MLLDDLFAECAAALELKYQYHQAISMILEETLEQYLLGTIAIFGAVTSGK